MTEKFFELIQITLGDRERFSQIPNEKEWKQLYILATKQSLTSFLIEGVNKVKNDNPDLNLNQTLMLEWIGVGLQTEAYNKLQNQRAKELYYQFKDGGLRGCILKGQGTALYYDHPEHRQCGDIDIWVEGGRDELLNFVKERGLTTDGIDYQHTNVKFFGDVEVEMHFKPSFMYSPFTNKRLQRFFEEKSEKQYSNFDERVGFTHTTKDFDLVFSMVHIYRHIFSEGIGLRQLVDYYYILSHSTIKQRAHAFDVLKSLSMGGFVGGIMWILKECFGMKVEYLLCPVNKRHGQFLLSEILTAGNFGQFDPRTRRIAVRKRFERGFVQLNKNLRFVSYYPSEVLWSPFWKLWHWGWRKWKGYL